MFETFMSKGGHRVDYLNPDAMGDPKAFGFYVRGEVPRLAVYSVTARRHLYAGLAVIEKKMDPKELVSVYLDINVLENIERPAYQHMKQDMRLGMFRRIFVYVSSDLLGHPTADSDLRDLYRELGGFELIMPEPVTDNEHREPISMTVTHWILDIERMILLPSR